MRDVENNSSSLIQTNVNQFNEKCSSFRLFSEVIAQNEMKPKPFNDVSVGSVHFISPSWERLHVYLHREVGISNDFVIRASQSHCKHNNYEGIGL